MPSLAQISSYTADLWQGRPAKLRSPKWAAIRDHFLLLHPTCAVCGYKKSLNVHHIRPYHSHPESELDTKNLITLGESCPGGNHHLWFGHCGNWKSYNPSVRSDAEAFLLMLRTRPEVPYRL